MAKEEVYAVIDLKSFYASCECAARGLDIFTTPLVVADPERSESTIVMSVTPFLKERYGVPNVCRVRDLPHLPKMIYAQPRMHYYLEMSAKVVSIFLDFIHEEDLHVYSVDESFLRLTPYLKLNGCTAEGLVEKIQKEIWDQLHLCATAGIGPNMFMAKTCLDNEGKKKPPYRARWYMEDVPAKLWKIWPITKVWGISTGISTRLSRMGIRSLEGLAKTPIEYLRKEFGIMGDQLHAMANGIDETDIREKYVPKETNLSQGQTLMRDYSLNGAKLVLKEMCDDLCVRLRAQGKKTGCVSLFVGYSAKFGGGFSHQCALNIATDDTKNLQSAVLFLFEKYAEPLPIRHLSISFSKLSDAKKHQTNLFIDPDQEVETKRLYRTLDYLSSMYGRNTVLRLSSLKEDSTIHERHRQIGGHKA